MTRCGLVRVPGSDTEASARAWVATYIFSASIVSAKTSCLGLLSRADTMEPKMGDKDVAECRVSYRALVVDYLTGQ